MPTRKQPSPEGLTAGAYAAALSQGAASANSELAELLSAAEARVVPLLTESLEETRLKELVAIVRERTRAQDEEVFRIAMEEYERRFKSDIARHLGPLLSEVVLTIRERQRKETASKAALARQPGKKAAKARVKAFWLERRRGMHPRLQTNNDFAIECLRRGEEFKFKTILGWCTQWEKEQRGIPAS